MNLPPGQRLSFESIVAGASHTCGITTRNWLYCWGDNAYGQLGDGTTDHREIPTRVLPDKEFVGLTAGAHHTCAVDTDETTWCWGRNDDGQLGDGSRDDRLQPVTPGVVTAMRP
jgi:alpha-tubulin suppressor-like RCC1 family protein